MGRSTPEETLEALSEEQKKLLADMDAVMAAPESVPRMIHLRSIGAIVTSAANTALIIEAMLAIEERNNQQGE